MMKARTFRKLWIGGGVLAGLCLCAVLLLPTPASAQCGDQPPDSTCYQCHEKEYPVFGMGEWHDIHARKDCCWQCHGGNTTADTAELAHQGMTANPLQDPQTDCYPCHPNDFNDRAQHFGALLGVSVDTQPPATPIIHQKNDGSPLVILPKPQNRSSLSAIVLIGPAFTALLFVLLFLLARRLQNQSLS